jgi:hypothetical protein
MKRIVGALAILSLLAPQAVAATVQPLNGEVFIDRGQGYIAIAGPTSANAGDVVMVLAGGSGEVLYEDGCRQAVELGTLVVIGEVSPCAAGPDQSPWASNYLIVGTLVVAGVVGAAIALSGDDSCVSQCTK